MARRGRWRAGPEARHGVSPSKDSFVEQTDWFLYQSRMVFIEWTELSFLVFNARLVHVEIVDGRRARVLALTLPPESLQPASEAENRASYNCRFRGLVLRVACYRRSLFGLDALRVLGPSSVLVLAETAVGYQKSTT